MRKNQKGEEHNKPLDATLKTGSEKKESTKKSQKKKESELNDPIYDVEVNADGGIESVVSEKAIDEVDFPPELQEFLGEMLVGIKDELGLSEDEDIPTNVMNEYIAKILSEVDIEELVRELHCEKVFKLESDEESSYIPDPDELTDEEIASMDFSKLDKDEFGNTLLATIMLEGADETKNTCRFVVPVDMGENTNGCPLVVHIVVPYLNSYTAKELEGPELQDVKSTSKFLTEDGEKFYAIEPKVYDSFIKTLTELGVTGADEAEVDLDLGDDVTGQIRELVANGRAIQGFDENEHEDGYDPETMEYWHDGKMYHEMDVIWLEIPRTINMMGNMKGFSANLDSFAKIYEPCDITPAKNGVFKDFKRVLSQTERFEIRMRNQKVEFFEKLLPQELVYYLATEQAKKEETAGYCIVCLDGKFYVPVESIYNYMTREFEDLIVAFNVINCYPIHHRCCGIIVADVGNMQIHTAVRFHRGGIFDWQKRINQELSAYYLTDSEFDPYGDPYDNPHNAFDPGGDN